MGIGYLGARMMWEARGRGVSFDRTLTLGHQALRLFPIEVEYFHNAYRDTFGSPTSPIEGQPWETYLDGFLRDFLDAKETTVLDASSYEGANAIHDMNTPVPEDWHSRYDVVIDGGTLEHIFNVPISFANLANMLKVGGTIFINTPANNLMGHGFYQFSPELMYRIFSDDNGFRLRTVLLYEASYPSVELTRKDTVYEVVDPDDVHQRVGLQNGKPVMMMVEAIKTREAQLFAQLPLQSDYVALWESRDSAEPRSNWRRRAKHAINALPIAVRAPILGHRQKRKFSLSNRDFYTRHRWRP